MHGSILTWADVDKHCKKFNLDRSGYIQRLVEKDLTSNKIKEKIVTIVVISYYVVTLIFMCYIIMNLR